MEKETILYLLLRENLSNLIILQSTYRNKAKNKSWNEYLDKSNTISV